MLNIIPGERRMTTNKKILIAVGIFALIVGWFLIPKRSEVGGVKEHAAEKELFTVKTMQAKVEKVQPTLVFNGVTAPSLRVALHPQSSGTVTKILVPEGVIVKAGTKLIDLSKGSQKQNVFDKKAALERAKVYYTGYQRLFEKGYISKANLLEAKADLKKAEFQLHAAKEALNDRAIYAPFKGSVSEYLVEIGDTMNYQNAGQIICGHFIQLDPLEVEIHANQNQIHHMREGLKAEILFNDGEVIPSEINFVKAEANITTQKYRMTALFPNSENRFKAGVSVKVRVKLDPQMVVSIPQSALSYDENHSLGVRIVDNQGLVEFKPVQMIQAVGNNVLIQGIDDGVKIIIQGGDFVQDGEKVAEHLAAQEKSA